MGTLNEVLKNYIGKLVKIGGSAGFFFCGKIPENYESLINDLAEVEGNKILKQMSKTRASLIEIEEKDYKTDFNLKTEDILTQRIPRQEYRYRKVKRMADCEVINTYKSTVDGATMIITDLDIIGNIYDKDSMLSKPALKELVDKYNL